MRRELHFVVEGIPVAKGRPKFTTINGYARAYTPKKTLNYENWVRLKATLAMSEAGLSTLDCPIELQVDVLVPIPASWSKIKQKSAADGELFATKKPDLDNVIKAIKDSLNGIVWRDDSLIVNLSAAKNYDERPRIEITVAALSEERE